MQHAAAGGCDRSRPDHEIAVRRAAAECAEAQRVFEETERLRAERAAEHRKWPIDNQRVNEIVEEMAALRGAR